MGESQKNSLAAGNRAVLEVDLPPDRLIVRVNGYPHELLRPADLPLAAYRTIQRVGPRIAVLSGPVRETTKAEAEELTQLLDRVCRLVLVAPDDVHARLGDLNRVLIAGAFFTQLPPDLVGGETALGLLRDFETAAAQVAAQATAQVAAQATQPPTVPVPAAPTPRAARRSQSATRARR
jgi:hypothetical protein